MVRNNESLIINRQEVLRYLGYKGQAIDDNVERIIQECICEAKEIIKTRYIYKFFKIDSSDGKIYLEGCPLNLEGSDIKKHLKDSETCALMAVTLGSFIDSRIRYYERADMTKALVLDACASAAVEEVCDSVCNDIKKKIKDKALTSRFSPGYGDLPLNIQKDFISVLGAETIGLTVSADSILIPRKSVTAVAGVIETERNNENNGCICCSKYSQCEYRRGNTNCGA